MRQKAWLTYRICPLRAQARRPIVTELSMAVRSATCVCSMACTCWRLPISRRSAHRLATMPSKNTMATDRKMRGTTAGCVVSGVIWMNRSVPGRFMGTRCGLKSSVLSSTGVSSPSPVRWMACCWWNQRGTRPLTQACMDSAATYVPRSCPRSNNGTASHTTSLGLPSACFKGPP
jgi:hypothetical protein